MPTKKALCLYVNNFLWTHTDPGDIITYIVSSTNDSGREKVTRQSFMAAGFQLVGKKAYDAEHITYTLPSGTSNGAGNQNCGYKRVVVHVNTVREL